jgi:hypothetical protein
LGCGRRRPCTGWGPLTQALSDSAGSLPVRRLSRKREFPYLGGYSSRADDHGPTLEVGSQRVRSITQGRPAWTGAGNHGGDLTDHPRSSQDLATWLITVAGVQVHDRRVGSAPTIPMVSRVAASSPSPRWLAGAGSTASGTPPASTAIERFRPCLRRSTGLGPAVCQPSSRHSRTDHEQARNLPPPATAAAGPGPFPVAGQAGQRRRARRPKVGLASGPSSWRMSASERIPTSRSPSSTTSSRSS